VPQQHQDRRITRPRGTIKLDFGDLSIGAHFALGSLAALVVAGSFTDFGTRELITTAYLATLLYGAMELCHSFLRRHMPAEPIRIPWGGLASYAVSMTLITLYLRGVTGESPFAASQETAAIATALFMLFFAAFLDPLTNRRHLRVNRDKKRPYASVPAWIPTWRAATLPMVVLAGIVHLGAAGLIDRDLLPSVMLLVGGGYVALLVLSSRRRGAPTA
jgi:hypothetical protein